MELFRKLENLGHLFESYLFSTLYGFPIKKIKSIFVTGSDGKTTTSYFIYNVLNSNGIKTGLVSTVEARAGDKTFDTGLHTTTPSKADLQKLLKAVVDEGCEYMVFEITSHGIDQHRIVGAHPEAAVITNITHEHLDYFKTFDKLVNTKAKIIPISKKAYLNKFAKVTPSLIEIAKKSNTPQVIYDREVMRKLLSDKWKITFPGDYNLENAAAAYSLAKDMGISEKDIIRALESSTPPVGRYKEVISDRDFKIIIDFAHTPNALEEVLRATKKQAKNRVIVVFGSAGLRDVTKRPLMGDAAGKYADITVLTAEDPRTEKVEDISTQIAEGLKKQGKKLDKDYYFKHDRTEAIDFAINHLAQKDDIVIITGKGHEQSMCFGTTEYPWSDEKAVLDSIKKGTKK